MKTFLIYYLLDISYICLGFLRNYSSFDEAIIRISSAMFLFYKEAFD